jgi:acyl-CoA thioesterase FadM
VVKKAPLPEYLSEYLAELPPIFVDNSQWLNEKRLITSKMVSVSASDIANRKQYLLDRQLFLTSTEDSNLVGNIYFSNYYSWQARIRDHYLFTLLPDIFQQHDKGEFSCVHAEVCHLQEAMPFDTIEVSMYMQELFEEGFTLYLEYYSISKQGEKRKLAHGVHTAIWTSGVLQETTIRPMKMPEVFLTNFKMMLNKQEAAV